MMSALSAFLEAESSVLERALTAWLPRRRWFRSKSRTLATLVLEAHAPLGENGDGPHYCILKTEFTDGALERYSLPLALLDRAETAGLPEAAILGPVNTRDGGKILCDASWDPNFRRALLELLTGKQKAYGADGKGVLQGAPASPALLETAPFTMEGGASKILGAEQSNTSFAYSSGNFVKLYRRLEEAVHPEPEVLRFLRTHTPFRHVPRFDASLEWTAEGRPPVTVALMQELVEARGDAWEYALENLRAPGGPAPAFSAWVSLLGRRVAGLHAALASVSSIPEFAPEPLTEADLNQVRVGTRTLLNGAFAALESHKGKTNEDLTDLIQKVVAGRARLEALIQTPAHPGEHPGEAPPALKIRTHGDLHLGQILVGAHSPDDVWILDFEGEPGRDLAEARRKHSPLRDAAGMLRSFHYAAHTVMRSIPPGAGRAMDAEGLAKTLRTAFLAGYAAVPGATGPRFDDPGFAPLLDLFILEKAVYELHYELNNRPDWMEIPLRGLLALLEETGP